MAEMDGFQAAQLIRQHDRARETPIIFLSAVHTETHYARQGYSLGAVDYIYKPYDPYVLRDKVRSFVALYRERHARRVAEDSVRGKDMILGVLGHDLRSPITAITATTSMLLRDEPEPARAAALLRMSVSAHRMDRMVRSLIDYARTYFGEGIPVHPWPENMGAICHGVVDEIMDSYPGKRVELTVSGEVEGEWDADRVAQAMTNLLVNAAEHAQGTIRVDVVGASDVVTVSVSNPGPFPEELRATLFQPFHKSDHKSRGLGLGLFIVRQVVLAHGGRVELLKTAEPETRFLTHWPRRAGDVASG
jgi:signal transduction histidine kinase